MTTSPSKPRRLGWLAVVAVVAGVLAWIFFSRPAADDPDAAPRTVATASNAASGAPGKMSAHLLDKPLWQELTRAQQLALEPLRPEWDAMDGARKKKWLEMSRRFASMNPAEQARVHERMRQWIRLTPEQRNLARENYSKARKLPPGQKTATWESYKQLSADQRQRLVQSAGRKKPATVNRPVADGIVTPTPCPAGTTRRGASCIAPDAPAPAPAAVSATPVTGQPTAPATPPVAPALPGAPATASPSASNASN